MNTTFDVNEYWLKRGRTYITEERLGLEYHRVQERFLFGVLRDSRLPMNHVVEVGCGFGRITKLLAGNFPAAQITALDLSPDQLAHARNYCAEHNNIAFALYDFYSGEPIPGAPSDCALAIEVFLHHPEPVFRKLIGRLLDTSRYLVNIDWSEHWRWKRPEHVWIHDYAELYASAGARCVQLPLPQKVDGKQQVLFIAGRELPPQLLELEWKQRSLSPPAKEIELSDGDEWLHQLEVARQEIIQHIPTGSSFILVNDDQWGEAQSFTSRRAIPFLEHDGHYWGPPANDATALLELERLRKAGATYIVFAWSSFWWLEHFKGLRQHLFHSSKCLLGNERLVAFQLNS